MVARARRLVASVSSVQRSAPFSLAVEPSGFGAVTSIGSGKFDPNTCARRPPLRRRRANTAAKRVSLRRSGIGDGSQKGRAISRLCREHIHRKNLIQTKRWPASPQDPAYMRAFQTRAPALAGLRAGGHVPCALPTNLRLAVGCYARDES